MEPPPHKGSSRVLWVFLFFLRNSLVAFKEGLDGVAGNQQGVKMRTIEREIVGALILSKDNKILLGKHREDVIFGGAWVIPGGGIESNENSEEALIREIAEETGIIIQKEYISLFDNTKIGETEKQLENGEKIRIKMNFQDFLVKIENPAQMIEISYDQKEFSDMRWFSFGELKDISLMPSLKSLFKRAGIL